MHKIFWQEWVKNYNKYGLLVNFLKLNTYLLKDFILFFNYMCVHVICEWVCTALRGQQRVMDPLWSWSYR